MDSGQGMRVVECVPNFSEGRRPEVVADIVASITAVQGVTLLDFSSDASHNRSVVTFVGTPEAAEAAAFAGIARARDLIDMEQHHGEHPRLGATDVVPFVPIAGVTMAECVDMARSLGRRVGRELEIPVYLYEEAATRPERRNLADVRRGEYEGLKLTIGTPERAPDFGPAVVHPTAGATVIGARMPLIAFNVNLGTSDVEIAKKIAKAGKTDGILCLGALIRGDTPHFDFLSAEVTKGLAQISIEDGLPVAFGILTVDTIEQGIERAGTKAGNKGYDAAFALIETLNLLKDAGLG